jgi:hypothetical protein
MSPVGFAKTGTAGKSVERPFVGPTGPTVSIAVDLDGLTANEIDENGYLKAGTPLLRTGALVGAGAVYGCVFDNTKVADGNTAAQRTAGGSPEVTVMISGAVNRAVLEDNLGRPLTAPEIAGFAAAGSLLKLLS